MLMSQSTTHIKEPDLIVFGGAFDPPHGGHVAMLRQVAARFPTARILVVPAAKPAAANHATKNVWTSFEHRCAMAKLAFAGIADDRLEISTIEQELPRPNLTLNTLQRLAREYEDQRLGFLLGQDQLSVFSQWHEPASILRLANLCIVKRDDTQQTTLTQTLMSMAAELGATLSWDSEHKNAAVPSLGSAVHVLNGSTHPANSTELRRSLSQQATLPAGWLPSAIVSYINQHQLYIT
jgi:nicotinate-nucleotide adenylyltransferase